MPIYDSGETRVHLGARVQPIPGNTTTRVVPCPLARTLAQEAEETRAEDRTLRPKSARSDRNTSNM